MSRALVGPDFPKTDTFHGSSGAVGLSSSLISWGN